MDTKGTILLADDEEVFLEATHDLLEEEGFSCFKARNAQELSTSLNTIDFDLLITDLNMPGNQVLEMVDEIRKRFLAIPVIVVTGYPSIPSAVESVRLNVLEYMIKPIDYQNLLDVARQGVEHKQILRSVRKAREEVLHRADQLEKIEHTLSRFGNTIPNREMADFNFEPAESHGDQESQGPSRATEQAGMATFPLELSSYVQLREALYETIEILQKTKGSFRSKVLADLRHKLEKLLKDTSPRDR